MNESSYWRCADLMEAAIDDELVGLDRDRGKVFGFNSVATDVWRKLAAPKTLDELCRELVGEYDVDPTECRKELSGLLSTLEDMGLVKRVLASE